MRKRAHCPIEPIPAVRRRAAQTTLGGHETDHEQTDAHHDPAHPGVPLHLTHDQDEWEPTDAPPPHAGPVSGGPELAAEPGRLAGMTKAHNQLRARLGVAGLAWDGELAGYAQAWAEHLQRNGCELQHRPADGKTRRVLGESLFWAWKHDAHSADVVALWADEERFYVPETGECEGGICGHFTQAVWRDSTHLGCGVAECTDTEVWVCNYFPPGNYLHEKAY
jgi:hypothetical protein